MVTFPEKVDLLDRFAIDESFGKTLSFENFQFSSKKKNYKTIDASEIKHRTIKNDRITLTQLTLFPIKTVVSILLENSDILKVVISPLSQKQQ